MQINLKQSEITAALKQYIVQQGFSLAGKTVEVTYTAGRAPAGMTAELVVEDQDIPGVELAPPESTGLKLVQDESKVTAPDPEAPAEKPANVAVEDEPAADAKAEASQAIAVAKSSTSLFN
jgi:hypothetical protein